MGYWHYVVAKKDFSNFTEFSIREAYYNDDDEIVGITETPSIVYGESIEEIKNILNNMMKDVNTYDVIDLDNIKFGRL